MRTIPMLQALRAARKSFLLVIIAVGLIAAGCTGSSSEESSTSSSAIPTTTAPSSITPTTTLASSDPASSSTEDAGDACEAMRTLLLDQTMRMNLDATQLGVVRVDLDGGELPDASVSGVYLTTGMRYEQAVRDLDEFGPAPSALEEVAEGYRGAFRTLADGYLAASEAVLDENVDELKSAIDQLVAASEIAQNEAIPACS